ncbi:MAG: GNAT family N-acetyltransferase [Chloroflexi bacterium]|nr:GNAT family N-acetyltransferase [Chloroflexota bacterium]
MKTVPADRYTFEQLTEAYNQTRVDYLVPMPMNVARLREYAHVYDVDMPSSCVAIEDNTMMGLGMLGVRDGRAWITRLGVLPSGRRKGVGNDIMSTLVAQAQKRGLGAIWLEVIAGNKPAHQLFQNFGFQETRSLIIARRPPNPHTAVFPSNIKRVTTLDHEEAIILLSHRQKKPNWLNETESLQNTRNLSALLIELEDGGRGWITYHAGLLQLTRILVEVTVGDPTTVTTACLNVLHHRHKRQDAKTENIFDDEQWIGYKNAGYIESFRRIEMVKKLK